MALLLRLVATLLLLGLPSLEAAAPPRPLCWRVAFDKAARTLNLEIVLPRSVAPAITGYTARATFDGRTVTPSPVFYSTTLAGDASRVNISFPIAAFASEPNGRFTFTAAAINADGVGLECETGIGYTVTRPAAPGLLGVTATCDTVKVEFARPEGLILIEDYVLTINGRTKVSPYRNTVVGGKKLLFFPAWPFTAGKQSLVLAAASMFGEGAASRTVSYTHTPCDYSVQRVVELEQELVITKVLADSAVRDNSTCTTQLQAARSDATTCASQLQAAKSDNATCATQLEAARSDATTCTSQLQAAKSDLAAAIAANATCATDLSQCRASLADCQTSSRTLADANAGLTAQLEQCKANLTAADGQLAECIRQRDACTTAKDGLQASLDTCNKDKAAAAAQCDGDKASLQTSLDSCNTRRAACNAARAAYEYECNAQKLPSGDANCNMLDQVNACMAKQQLENDWVTPSAEEVSNCVRSLAAQLE